MILVPIKKTQATTLHIRGRDVAIRKQADPLDITAERILTVLADKSDGL